MRMPFLLWSPPAALPIVCAGVWQFVGGAMAAFVVAFLCGCAWGVWCCWWILTRQCRRSTYVQVMADLRGEPVPPAHLASFRRVNTLADGSLRALAIVRNLIHTIENVAVEVEGDAREQLRRAADDANAQITAISDVLEWHLEDDPAARAELEREA